MVTGDGDLEVDVVSSFVRDRPHNEHDTGSVETDKPQSADSLALVAVVSFETVHT